VAAEIEAEAAAKQLFFEAQMKAEQLLRAAQMEAKPEIKLIIEEIQEPEIEQIRKRQVMEQQRVAQYNAYIQSMKRRQKSRFGLRF